MKTKRELSTIIEIACKCGWYREAIESISWTQAEIIGDRHESGDIRHPYKHAITVSARQEAF